MNQNNEQIKLRKEDIQQSNIYTEINVATLNRTNNFLQDHLGLPRIDRKLPQEERYKLFDTHVSAKLNNRVKIDTGKFCNARCQFCYYFESLTNRDFLSLDEIKEQGIIPKLFEKGIYQFEFSGGEPTLNWELSEIIAYIKEVGEPYLVTPTFSIVSNGYKLQECLDANPDITEVLISLHGNDEHHPQITQISKSYDKIMEFIDKNLIKHRQNKLTIRINVVVTGYNLTQDFMTTLFCLVLNGIQINLLPLNFWNSASNMTITKEQYNKIYYSINRFFIYMKGGKNKPVAHIIDKLKIYNSDKFEQFQLAEVPTETIVEALITSINKYRDLGSKLITIRYAEACRLNDLARPHVMNHVKHLFDQKDWSKIFYPRDYKDTKNNFDFTRNQNLDSALKTLYSDRIQSNYVDTICKKCYLFNAHHCDGLKYIDQNKRTIFKETEEEYEIRMRWRDKKHIRLGKF